MTNQLGVQHCQCRDHDTAERLSDLCVHTFEPMGAQLALLSPQLPSWIWISVLAMSPVIMGMVVAEALIVAEQGIYEEQGSSIFCYPFFQTSCPPDPQQRRYNAAKLRFLMSCTATPT
jgi:hypothetical protein